MALPASMRLRGHRCFNHLHRTGRRHHGQLLVLRVVQAEVRLLRLELRRQPDVSCRCALVISSKVSKRAVKRNRLRRRLHDHLRQRLESRQDLAGLWLLFSMRPEAGEVDPSQLLKECDSLLRDAGLEG